MVLMAAAMKLPNQCVGLRGRPAARSALKWAASVANAASTSVVVRAPAANRRSSSCHSPGEFVLLGSVASSAGVASPETAAGPTIWTRARLMR